MRAALPDRLYQALVSADAGTEAVSAPLAGRRTVLTYGQLRAALAAVAARLEAAGVGRSPVGVLANRSAEAYVSVLACYLAGVPFVPLNPGFPESRRNDIADMAALSLILSESAALPADTADRPPVIDVTTLVIGAIEHTDAALPQPAVRDSTDMAYQLFTSGSTGKPKGVPISYRNLGHYVAGISAAIDFSRCQRFSQTFDLSFDLSLHDVFVCFVHGGTLVAATDMDLMMPAAYIKKQRLDHWFSVPVLADVALRSMRVSKPARDLKLALFCGEALPLQAAHDFSRAFVREDGQTWNLYGPTEATIAFTACQLPLSAETAGVAPLGAAFGANVLGVLDEAGAVHAVSGEPVSGELLLAGPQVFSGYRPAVAKDCFVDANDTRYYRSGDNVQVDEHGLQYKGRVDFQVKVRGYRIELQEIEQAFRDTFGVQLVAALVVGEGTEAAICVAYQSPDEIDGALADLAQRLPDYMVPAKAARFNDLPLNVNGKIDRKLLATFAWSDV